MTKGRRQGSPLTAIIERLKADLAELNQAAEENEPSAVARRKIDAELRELMTGVDMLLRDLDPVRHPRFMFDPGNPAVVGRFIGLAMISQPRAPLETVERFYGSGIYALYYNGDHGRYPPIKGTETPIYVGKADPRSDTAKQPIEQGEPLFTRLKDHRRSIRNASETLRVDDFEYRSLVVQSGWQGAAEDYLIHLFRPVWNNETGVCYGLGKHGDDPRTRANKRSPWDTLHPGRDWAGRDPNMVDAKPRDQIEAELKAHFDTVPVYKDLDQVLREFVEELRQL